MIGSVCVGGTGNTSSPATVTVAIRKKVRKLNMENYRHSDSEEENTTINITINPEVFIQDQIEKLVCNSSAIRKKIEKYEQETEKTVAKTATEYFYGLAKFSFHEIYASVSIYLVITRGKVFGKGEKARLRELKHMEEMLKELYKVCDAKWSLMAYANACKKGADWLKEKLYDEACSMEEAELKHVKRPRAEDESGSEAGNARKRGRRTKVEVAEELEEMRKNGCLV